VRLESRLPGLSAWQRVADYRLHRLRSHDRVALYAGSRLDAAAVSDFGADRVFVATGAHWRGDGVGRSCRVPLAAQSALSVLTPDAVMAGQLPEGDEVVVYDDDQCYLAAVIAEKLAKTHRVTFVTPGSVVSAWTDNTLEQERIQRRLVALGVRILCGHTLSATEASGVLVQGVYGEAERHLACGTVIPVTERVPDDALFHALRATHPALEVELIGDALCPALIADAVFDGHRAARNFDRSEADVERELFVRELPALEGTDRGA